MAATDEPDDGKIFATAPELVYPVFAVERFYDADDNYHVHDRNIHETVLTCRFGHSWSVFSDPVPCPYGPCEWNDPAFRAGKQ